MSNITLQKSKAPVVEGEFDEADEPDHLLAGLCPQRTVFFGTGIPFVLR